MVVDVELFLANTYSSSGSIGMLFKSELAIELLTKAYNIMPEVERN